MRSTETLRIGNWLWDILHDRYITIVALAEPMQVQSAHQEYFLGAYNISHIRIDQCPVTELGFTIGPDGHERISKSGKKVLLRLIGNGYCLCSNEIETECIWLVDQLQNQYEDITKEKLVISLIGSKIK